MGTFVGGYSAIPDCFGQETDGYPQNACDLACIPICHICSLSLNNKYQRLLYHSFIKDCGRSDRTFVRSKEFSEKCSRQSPCLVCSYI